MHINVVKYPLWEEKVNIGKCFNTYGQPCQQHSKQNDGGNAEGEHNTVYGIFLERFPWWL